MDITKRMARSACFMALMGCEPLPASAFAERTEIMDDDFVRSGDEIIDQIFVPDPVTGYPRSDLAVMYSKDTSPIIADYIQRNLMRPLDDSIGTDNPDDALALIKDKRETLANFTQRIRDLFKKS